MISRPTQKALMKGPLPSATPLCTAAIAWLLSADGKKKGNFLRRRRASLFWLEPGTRWLVRLGGPIISRDSSAQLQQGPTQASTSFKFSLPAFPLSFLLISFIHPSFSNGSARRSLPSPCENGVSERHPLGCRRQRHRTAAVAACLVSFTRAAQRLVGPSD